MRGSSNFDELLTIHLLRLVAWFAQLLSPGGKYFSIFVRTGGGGMWEVIALLGLYYTFCIVLLMDDETPATQIEQAHRPIFTLSSKPRVADRSDNPAHLYYGLANNNFVLLDL